MRKLTDAELRATVQLVLEHGSQRAAARVAGIPQAKISQHLKEAKARGIVVEPKGDIQGLQALNLPLPDTGRIKRYYLTSAQDYTKLHAVAWKNLLAFVEHDDAKLLISTFKYDKDAMGQRERAKWETREAELRALYPAEILPYVCDDRVNIAPNLTFCGELNILPTAEYPLSGLESYTHRNSTIVPHPKIEVRSVPTMKGEGVKLMFTTGCITQRNYIKRKVGYKAEHFHAYGALIVEVDDKGRWYCRQVTLGHDGTMYDMDRRAYNGRVTTGHRVQAITWGDVHASRLDEVCARVSWGKQKTSMLETLRPYEQHVHDLLDFSGRSHHTRRDPHEVYASHKQGKWEATHEFRITADVLWNQIARPWCDTYVVNSNHDRHLDRWLKEVDWRFDPANAKTLLAMNLAWLDAIDAKRSFMPSEHALLLYKPPVDSATEARVRFLPEDASHVLLPEIDGGIECGLHGDRGANGAKGTLQGFANVDRKINFADKHAIGWRNHALGVGTSGVLDMGFNKGLSSWTHAHGVTYVNGQRAIYSIWKGKWHG